MVYPHKWSPVSYRSSAVQEKFAGKRPAFYHCTSHGTGTLRCLQNEMATYRHWSVLLVARPRRCLTLSNPVTWQNWMAAYPGYTLRMKTLFRGWPVMVNDTHTRRSHTLCHFCTFVGILTHIRSHILYFMDNNHDKDTNNKTWNHMQ